MKLLHIILCITLLALGACGGEQGGESTSTNPSTLDDPVVIEPPPRISDLTVSSDRIATIPYDVLTLTVSSPPQDVRTSALSRALQEEETYQVQFDISGQSTFLPDTTVNIPAIAQNGVLLVAVPPATPEASSSTAHTIGMRVMNLSRQQTSNVVMLQVQAPDIPAAAAGRPTAALQLLLKALYVNSNPRLKSAASTVNLTTIWDDAAALGEDTTGLDQHAEGILRGVFGVSAIDSPTVTVQATRAVALDTRSLEGGVSNIVTCIDDHWHNSSLTQAADECVSITLKFARDEVIGGIQNITGKVASIFTLARNRISSSAVGQYLTRFISAAETAEYAGDFGKLALSENTGDRDSVLSDIVRGRIYGHLTEGLDENTQALLDLLDAQDVTDALLNKTLEQADALRGLEDQLIQNVSGLDDLRNRSKDFGGPSEPGDEPRTVPLPGDGTLTVPNNVDPSEFCAMHPTIGQGLEDRGITCTQIVGAITDADFFHDVLEPLSASFIALSQRFTQACGAQFEFFDSPACQEVQREVQDLNEQFLQAIEQYGEPDADFKCQGGYVEFPSSVEDTAACIHRSLLETAHNADCPPGSTQAAERGIDVGDASVCVIYSRDFIQQGGTCREGYSLVEYLGTERCRWDGLSTREVAAYSLDKRTGRRTTVLP
jgi:hypothetical protein